MFKIRTIPRNDELLSSWLIRAAFDWGCDPLSFTSIVWPSYRVWTIDRDRGIPEKRLARLCQEFDVNNDAIERLFLYQLVCTTTNHKLTKNNYWPWVIPYGLRNRSSLGAIQFCPKCIRETSSAYIKRRWRMAWNTVCAHHMCTLIDSCPNCFKPLQIQQILLVDRSLVHCVYCNHSVDFKKTCDVDSTYLKAQTLMRCSVNGHSFHFWEEERSSSDFFSVLRLSISLLHQFSTRPRTVPSELIALLRAGNFGLHLPASGLTFEQLPLGTRERMIRTGLNIFDLEKSQVLEVATKYRTLGSLFQRLAQYDTKFCPDILEAIPSNQKIIARRLTGKTMIQSRSSVELKLTRLIRKSSRQRR